MLYIIPFLPAAIWYGLIFSLSAQPAAASSSLSDGILWKVLRQISPAFASAERDAQAAAVEILSYFERKAAHMFLFFVLALLLCFALRRIVRAAGARRWAAIALCAVCAGADEYHQTFVAGRSGQPEDVLVDLLGAAAGIGFLLLVGWLQKRRGLPAGRRDWMPALICTGLAALLAGGLCMFASPLLQWAPQRFMKDFAALDTATQSLLRSQIGPILLDVIVLLFSALLAFGVAVSATAATGKAAPQNLVD